ncbi:ABC-F family ATP-binding cassette domain-containing protein [Fulvivirgaceae bacterium BMA12]|uniref:ABC-F family ATP-binding cassette domain-containing protein n=1 Tax=Agaribacillus aureus TaxID=3051825 RepID=A0ABT8L3F2_9BACT|nr:ABC-F family ATP-binding cassette domain-containing protein [Fulvivirgaceae bacterium BMA12]
MNYLSVESLSKSFNEKDLLTNISFGLSQGEKMGLVGINGSGKSTLLKILAGLEQPESGKVVFRKDINIAYLDQHPRLHDEDTILEAVFNTAGNARLDLIKSYEYQLNLAETGHADEKELQKLMEQLDDANAWDYESTVKQILGKLGIENFDLKVGTLSGGQKKRVALARALIEKPDLLIIDEPTNHLDIDTIEWLENYLANQQLTLLLVTHDRYFLDTVTNGIIELEAGKIHRYQGNYSHFLDKKLERIVQEKAEVDKARNLMKKELDWMRRQPKARGTKAKYRVDAFHELKQKAGKKTTNQQIQLNVKTTRQGGKILEMKDVVLALGGKSLIDGFSYTFKKGDRIGIIGKNGVGKTTFLNLLTNKRKPDSGLIDWGQTTQIGYYTQDSYQFENEQRVIDVVKEVAEVIKLADGSEVTASQLLNLFLFPPEMQYNVVGKLSGGERRRLQLLRVLIQNPNFLVLDEPTNDLDLQTLNVLEEFLMGFRGCLLIVSHDRYFIDKLVDHSFIFEGHGQIKDFPGNYTDYRQQRASELSEEKRQMEADKPKKEKIKKPDEKKTKLSFKERREFEELSMQIDAKEAEKKVLVEKMNSGNLGHQELMDIGAEIARLDEEIELKTDRWLNLSEYA